MKSKIISTMFVLSVICCSSRQEPANESSEGTSHTSESTGPMVEGSTSKNGTVDSETSNSDTNDDDTADSPPFVVPLTCHDLLETDPQLLEPCHTAGWSVGGVIRSQTDLETLSGQKCISDSIIMGEVNGVIDLSPLFDVQVICGALSLHFFDGGVKLRNLSALKNLRAVGGFISLHGLRAEGLEAFENLELTSNLQINDFQKLRSVAGLSSLRRVKQIQISRCPS